MQQKEAIEDALRRLNVSKIDSVLIHKPHYWEGACNRIPDGTWQDSYRVIRRILFRRDHNKINHDDDSNDDDVLYSEDYTIQRNNGPDQVYFITPTRTTMTISTASNTGASSDDSSRTTMNEGL